MKKQFALLIGLFLCLSFLSSVFSTEVLIESHSEAYPRIGTSALVVLPNGSLLAVFSGVGTGENLTMFGKISSNGGSTWSQKYLIKNSADSKPSPCSMLTLVNKTFLFYNRIVYWDSNGGNCSIWVMESEDNGQTWSNDRQIESSHNYTVCSLSVLKMKNGTLILPFSWWQGYGVYRWQSSVFRSDDNTTSWQQGGVIPDDSEWTETGNDEPAVVELANSSIYCLVRTIDAVYPQFKHRYSLSNDYGLNWSNPLRVPEMNAQDTTPALTAFSGHSWQPNIVIASWINRTFGGLRTPLVLAISIDNCSTWRAIYVLDNLTNTSKNDMTFCLTSSKILLSYRRYHEQQPMNDDSVLQIFNLRQADFNYDGTIDIMDQIHLQSHMGSSDPQTDLNHDGTVDLFDAIAFANQFGKSLWNTS